MPRRYVEDPNRLAATREQELIHDARVGLHAVRGRRGERVRVREIGGRSVAAHALVEALVERGETIAEVERQERLGHRDRVAECDEVPRIGSIEREWERRLEAPATTLAGAGEVGVVLRAQLAEDALERATRDAGRRERGEQLIGGDGLLAGAFELLLDEDQELRATVTWGLLRAGHRGRIDERAGGGQAPVRRDRQLLVARGRVRAVARPGAARALGSRHWCRSS
ncbi:MAG TPA: hypothetical protein VG755_12945 [Nannocystaceae bacterium]|nr:hypothetical protein [Nannocystaceae bacterium]